MTTLAHVFAVTDLPRLTPSDFREALEKRLRDGAHPITMFGRPGTEGRVVVTAILDDRNAGGQPTVLRTEMAPEVGYHALTPEFLSMHAFERELHEQYRVRVAGHPWLKPIRFEHAGPGGRDAYDFYEIKGKEVHEVAVGPVHAGVIEPGAFRFMCLGEQVHHLEIHLGYQHRGVEKLLRASNPRTLAPLVETIAGDTSIGHGWAYCAALEALAGIIPERSITLGRAIMLELERIAMHLASLAGLAADIGWLQGASTYGRLRTTAINTSMRLCGSRFGRGTMRPGGLGLNRGPNIVTGDELKKNLDLLVTDLAIIDPVFERSRTARHRLDGVGIVSAELARSIGLVGMAARASGVPRDVRFAESPESRYLGHPLEVHTEKTGDCWARAQLRIVEMRRSLAWLGAALGERTDFEPVRSVVGALAPETLAVAVVEGWRGEIVHALETDVEGGLAAYKVQDPSFRNWLGLALAVRENEISDFPICNKSFDLSYCGNDL